jgi:hypothetical protein
MKQKHQNVHSKKKQNFQVSQQHQLQTKALQSLMTMLKKLGQLDTIIKLSLLASA